MSQNPYEQHPSKPDYPGIPATVYGGPSSNYGPYGSPNTPPPPPGPNNIGTNPYDPYDPYAPPTVISQQPNLSPTYPAYPAQPGIPPIPTPMPPPQKKSASKMVLVAVIALLVIVGGSIFGVVSYNNNIYNMHANATATAQTQARAQATAQAQTTANAWATATAGPLATATALATSPYPSFSNVSLSDSLSSNSSGQWSESSACSFTGGSYQVSLAQQGYFQPCPASSTSFSDFAYQVNMTITAGDCGGLLFRGSHGEFYRFEVCQDGTYGLFVHKTNGQGGYLLNWTNSSNIHMGLNQTNLLAVVVQGWSISMYVNDRTKPIQTMTDPTNAFSKGYVGVFADAKNNPTTVAFTNAFVWTA